MPPRPFMLHESNYRQLLEHRPNVALLPWGATEAHNYHLPHGTDVIEAAAVAERAAELAFSRGAKPIVLPAIPFGNNAQQLDQVATISFSTATAIAILNDVASSLLAQKIDRLIIVNSHGGNDFKPLVRDAAAGLGMLMVVVNFWQMLPDVVRKIFDEPGDHAGELETSLLMHLCPQWVQLEQAGAGESIPFAIAGLQSPGVWTPRPWSKAQPDTGSGNPAKSTAEKGKTYFDTVTAAVADVVLAVGNARKGDLPYV